MLLLTPLSLRPASVLSVIYRFYASLQCQTLYNFFIGNKNGSLRPVCLCKNKSATSLTPELSLVFKSTLPSVLILYIFFVSICIFCIYIYTYTLYSSYYGCDRKFVELIIIFTSSTAQGGGGSRKTIGEIGCCESRMSKQKH